MKRLLPILILLLIVLISCGETESTDPVASDTTAAANDEMTIQTVTEKLTPALPETDMNGKTFTVYTTGWYDYTPMQIVDIAPESASGETLNDAAFDRKLFIEQTYNCVVKQINEADMAVMIKNIKNSVMAQDNNYDTALIRGTNFAEMITGGYLLNLDELTHVDFDQPWWSQSSYKAFGIQNKHYGVNGAFSSNEMMAVWTVCFSKDIIEDYDMESPYDLVKNGTWTFDKAVDMAKLTAHDIDGDGIMGEDDFWGINYTYDTVIGILNAVGVRLVDLDNSGTPVIKIEGEMEITRMQDIITKLKNEDYSADTLGKFDLQGLDGKIFGEGHNLFMFTATHNVNALRQMDVEFGLIPYPKYDETQAEYMPGTAGIFLPILCVPATNTDLDNTGIFMEAFAAEGYYTVVPAFYDVILKSKLARDDDSVEMLDYIYGNIIYDAGNVFNFGNFTRLIGGITTDISSFLAANMNSLQKGIDDVLAEINK